MLDGLKTAALLVPLLIVCGVALLAEPDRREETLACVTGEAAQNPTQTAPDGRILTGPRLLNARTLEEARAFACVDAPEPTATGEWQLRGIAARRTASLGDEGRRTVQVDYWIPEEPQTFVSIWVSNHIPRFDDPPPAPGRDVVEASEVDLRGTAAALHHRTNGTVISWQEENLQFAVFVTLPESRTIEADVLPLLESME